MENFMVGKITAVYRKFEDFWVGFVEEIPGVNTQGKTLEETKENLKEALELVIQTNRELIEKEMPKDGIVKEEFSVAV
jgi:predicted RNase H-like HicB family nuclease